MYFSLSVLDNIDQIFRTALNEGRSILYEYEVYRILKEIGLEVPESALVEDVFSVDDIIMKPFKEAVVVKIVSQQIAHKQKLGGVKIIRNLDPLFVQYVMTRMKEEVLLHFHENDKPEIKGFLLTEFIPHTHALGYEVLFGLKEDPAFGPVLTLSKGGDDAEFFAKYYDPANLFLPPLDMERAKSMISTLNIRYKFEQSGHVEYLGYMAKTASVLSQLAYHYSFVSDEKPEFIIRSMDINPFVITDDGRFVAIDGFAQFTPAREKAIAVPPVNLNQLDAFFRPNGIAVIGVSSDTGKSSLGRDIAQLLLDLGRKDLYFVNSKGGSTRLNGIEYPLYNSILDIHSPVELVVYAAPAQHTIDFMKLLTGTDVKGVILISGIPSNLNYAEFKKQMDTAVPKTVRIIGPNCMGVFFAPDEGNPGLNTLFINEKRLEVKHSPNSNCVLLTQSGALAVTAIDKLQNSRVFKSVISFGNKYDIRISDLMAYFSSDSSVDLISIYAEGLDAGEGRRFFELAGKIKKPVIAYKSGRTEAGARAAASHTASMSGSYEVFKAACQQSGVILAEKMEDHYDYVKVFSMLARKIPSSNQVAGVVNAGFESTVGADELKNLRQASLSVKTVERLNRINVHGLVDTSSPFLDVTPMADDTMYADFVEAILQDENVNCIFVAIVPHAVSLKTDPETCHDPDGLANRLVELSKAYHKPMVVSVNAGRYYQEFVSIMEQNGLPVYADIRSAIKSLDRFVSYHMEKHERLGLQFQ